MKKRGFPLLAVPAMLFGMGVWSCGAQAALSDVTQPGDAIELVNGVNDGDGSAGIPPAAEGVEHAIDNLGQKYLNFLDLGSGFIVTPTLGAATGGTVLSGLRFYTANDAIQRDPASYVLEGASSAGGPFTLISESDLQLPDARNPGGLNSIDTSGNFFEVSFVNHTAYLSYRLTFPTLKDAANANSMQIGEVEFLGELVRSAPVSEPATASLVGLVIVALLSRRRGRIEKHF